MTAAGFALPVPAAEPAGCFHCGLPLGCVRYPVTIDGLVRETCCRGCQAVAETIAQNGLGSYYRYRSAPAARPDAVPHPGEDLLLYDLPEVQHGFVREAAPHEKEATLLFEGITCAACVWLIEQRLAALEGVSGVDINYAARRGRVRWDERRARLSAILQAVSALGYRAQPYDGARSDSALRRERRALQWRLAVAALGMMQVMMYALPAYMSDGGMSADIAQLMRWASFALTVPVMAWSAMPFYRGAWRDLTSRRIGMDVPIALGIVLAFGASAYATFAGAGEVYFDTVTMFVFLLLGARYLEMGAREKAARTQDELAKATPAFAERLERYPASAAVERVPVAVLRPGDHVIVRPGGVIPADGTVVAGESAADESLLTGEAQPVPKRPGDALVGGAVNLHGALTARVDRVGQDTILSGIVRLMDRAQCEKPAIALTADRAARRFLTVLLVFTGSVSVAWYGVDPARALWIAVALLVVSCPCALSLATPAALCAGTSALHRCGVLATRGHALETLGAATHFVFDKTGTLTSGEMGLIGVMPLAGEDRTRCLALAAQLERGSEHPIGRAIVAAAGPVEFDHTITVRNVAGRGLEAALGTRRLRIGTPSFVAELNGRPLPDELLFVSDDVTAVALGDAREFIALFTLGDALRPHAALVVNELKALGKTVCLLSGDRRARTEHVARQLEITVARGAATPQDKVDFVRALQAQGAVVAMIGDGVNDAPVLGQAQVSIALAGGTHLARSSADMLLMAEDLDALIAALRIARATGRNIRQNLASSVAYNAVVLPLAALGYITPLVAAAGMSLSSLAVVGNALRLLRLAPALPRSPRDATLQA